MRRFPLYALLACAPMAASAGDEVGHFYFGPEVGGISASGDRGTKEHDWVYGLDLGYNFSEDWTADVNLNSVRLKDELDPGHLRLSAASLDVLRVFNRSSMFAPYIAVGLGNLHYDTPDSEHSRDNFFPEAGLGAFIKLWENGNASSSFSLKPDFRVRWDDDGRNGHLRDYVATMAFVFSFGPGTKAPPAPTPPPPPPPPQPAPASAPVVTTPPDSDGDGVPDSIDRCPNTPHGVAVDQWGCPRKGSIVLEGVTFETNSAILTADSRPVLNEVADGLNKHPRLKVELQGYTDSTGSDKYNVILSDKRANSVRQYLLGQNVRSEQLVSKGYGKADPVASNATVEGRAKNRRVVMKVLENPGDVTVKGASETQQ
ncbi:MAG: OmpA family protein [Steroidobacteraceae bacterium]